MRALVLALIRGLLFIVIGAAALGAAAAGYLLLIYPGASHEGDGTEVDVAIPQGSHLRQIALLLERAGVVDQRYLFEAYVRARGVERGIRAGHHPVANNLPPREVLRHLLQGGVEQTRLLVPEGATMFDIARALDQMRAGNPGWTAGAFLEAVREPALLHELGIAGDSAEGYLFPDTYDLRRGMAPDAIIRRMVARFRAARDTVLARHPGALGRLATSAGLGEREVVILASIIEKEARVPAERALMAGVFLNRLTLASFVPARHLQADPTIGYGCLLSPEIPSCVQMTGRLTSTQTEDAANPYNTYRHPGVPPGPICNPGLASIEAVLAPAQTTFLYFVARGDGTHAFSETYEQHTQAARPHRRRRRR